MWIAGTPFYLFQISPLKSSSQWENALFGYTCNPYRRGGGGGGSIRKLWPLGIPDITIKTWVYLDETRISHLYHYVCEQLEILLIFSSEFTSNIQQPIIKSKHSRTCNRYRKGGSESCGFWVFRTLQLKLEYAGMKLEYLSYITMYVNS